MIKLSRVSRPTYLTDQVVADLTAKFKLTGESVWNDERLKAPLRGSSYGKCAYCECSVTEESKYMEVEHFKDKSSYPDDVIVWENLLPSCKRCNGIKGGHDVLEAPIINPYEDIPRDHVVYKNYRLKGITDKGVDTIEAVGLNGYERVALKRFEIGNAVLESLDECALKLSEYEDKKTTRSRNRVSRFMEDILSECQPSATYAATTASIAVHSEVFLDLMPRMKSVGAWSQECEMLYLIAVSIALPVR